MLLVPIWATYRKLLCIAFRFGCIACSLDEKYPCFVYHDGVFESLDDRKNKTFWLSFVVMRSWGYSQSLLFIDFGLACA